MDASAISHIAICVADLDKSLEFYRDNLGMEVLADRIQDTTTGGLPHVYKHQRNTRRQVNLAYGKGNVKPTLTMTSHPGDNPDGNPIKLDQIGISHISFTVPDVKSLASELFQKESSWLALWMVLLTLKEKSVAYLFLTQTVYWFNLIRVVEDKLNRPQHTLFS